MKRTPKPAPVDAPSDRLRVRLDMVLILPRASDTMQMPDGTDAEKSERGRIRCAQAWLDLFATELPKRSIRVEDSSAAINLDIDRRKPRRSR